VSFTYLPITEKVIRMLYNVSTSHEGNIDRHETAIDLDCHERTVRRLFNRLHEMRYELPCWEIEKTENGIKINLGFKK